MSHSFSFPLQPLHRRGVGHCCVRVRGGVAVLLGTKMISSVWVAAGLVSGGGGGVTRAGTINTMG